MKKITITNIGDERQSAVIEGVEEMDASDGYHTFTELYEHRIQLYIALCRERVNVVPDYDYPVWCSTLHHDGSSFGDWFILGMGKEKGKQITYHLPARFWNEVCEFAEVIEKAPEWDGHTSNDVLKRLKEL